MLGGLVGGTGDLLFALVFAATRGTGPLRLLQVVASGAFGAQALEGGLPMALAGLLGHFLLSLTWAALIVIAVARTRVGSWFAVPAGVLVFFTMRLVVLPLSAYPYPVTFAPLPTALDLASHVILFAAPITFFAQRALPPRTR